MEIKDKEFKDDLDKLRRTRRMFKALDMDYEQLCNPKIGNLKKYDDNLGMGTAMSYLMLMPYTIGFGLVWIIMMAVWFYLKLPLGS